MIRCIALSPSLDVTYLIDDFEVGAIARPTQVVRTAGGKALNVARVAAGLGAPVSAIALLGGHTGRLVRDLLGVPVTVVELEAETRTCISIASQGELTELYERSASVPATAWDEVVGSVDEVEAGDWLAIAGSVPDGIPLSELAGLVRMMRSRGAHVAIDTHGPALAALVDAGPDVVKVNRAEAAALLGSDGNAGELAVRLRERTGGTVVVTDGVAGSCAAASTGPVVVAADPVRGAYPVGSGDAYLGGLLAALAGGEPIDVALHRAAACASANAMQPGAGLIDPTSVDAAYDRIVVS